MPTTADLAEPLYAGTSVLVDATAGRLRLWAGGPLVGGGPGVYHLVWVDGPAGADVQRLDVVPPSSLPTAYPLTDPGVPSVAAGLERIRSAVVALAAVEATGAAFPTSDGALARVPGLGLACITADGRVLRSMAPLQGIASAQAKAAAASPVTPSAAVAAVIDATAARLLSWAAALDDGALLGGDRYGGQRFFRLAGHTLALRPEQAERPSPGLVVNPHAARSEDPWALLDASPLTARPWPPGLVAVRAQLAEGLALPPEAVVDRLVGWVRGGASISGGPTSDQSWTLSWADGAFRMSGTNPDGEHESRAVPEPEVRTMFRSYRMFGLSGR